MKLNPVLHGPRAAVPPILAIVRAVPLPSAVRTQIYGGHAATILRLPATNRIVRKICIDWLSGKGAGRHGEQVATATVATGSITVAQIDQSCSPGGTDVHPI